MVRQKILRRAESAVRSGRLETAGAGASVSPG
jgi:hypothetical protein